MRDRCRRVVVETQMLELLAREGVKSLDEMAMTRVRRDHERLSEAVSQLVVCPNLDEPKGPVGAKFGSVKILDEKVP